MTAASEISWTTMRGLHPGDVYYVMRNCEWYGVARRRAHGWWDCFLSPAVKVGDHFVPFSHLTRDRRKLQTFKTESSAKLWASLHATLEAIRTPQTD